jgi:catechol 2,3-dioxygenase-like lactoylglutathione lyase family enzyme
MNSKAVIFQVCVVVEDVRRANANWAQILGRPEAEIHTIFSGEILHFTHGLPAEYTDCQVAKYELDAFVLELIQPGPAASPWREHLERHGQGVFHVCLKVDDRRSFQQTLSDIGVALPYHVGYYPSGSYSYVDSSKQLGLDLSVNHHSDYARVMQGLRDGTVLPLDEMK